MLKKWIDEIRNQPDLYKSECWKYHLSGNVVEISILPEYLKKKRLYRCSVIAVGQVLQALSNKIEEEYLNFHIQSFPSLENPEIVASIRTDQKGNFTNHNGTVREKINDQEGIKTTLQDLVQKHQFTLRKVEDLSEIQMDKLTKLQNYSTWYIISSDHNNPFTWLNVGYLKESLRNSYTSLPVHHVGIFDLCSDQKTQPAVLQISDTEYLQSLVGIQSANVST